MKTEHIDSNGKTFAVRSILHYRNEHDYGITLCGVSGFREARLTMQEGSIKESVLWDTWPTEHGFSIQDASALVAQYIGLCIDAEVRDMHGSGLIQYADEATKSRAIELGLK